MRLSNFALLGPSNAGAAIVAVQNQWLPALIILVVASTVSLVVWDVRRAGGLAKWAQGWDEFVDQRSRRRAARLRRRLQERQKRREIKRNGKRHRGEH